MLDIPFYKLVYIFITFTKMKVWNLSLHAKLNAQQRSGRAYPFWGKFFYHPLLCNDKRFQPTPFGNWFSSYLPYSKELKNKIGWHLAPK